MSTTSGWFVFATVLCCNLFRSGNSTQQPWRIWLSKSLFDQQVVGNNVVPLRAPPTTQRPWRRPILNELYFYNSIDGAIANGWSDSTSHLSHVQYNTDVPDAFGVAKVALGGSMAKFQLTADRPEREFSVERGDQLRCRIRLECPTGNWDCARHTKPEGNIQVPPYSIMNRVNNAVARLQLALLDGDGANIVNQRVEIVPQWRVIRATVKKPGSIAKLRLASREYWPMTFYVSYCFVQKKP